MMMAELGMVRGIGSAQRVLSVRAALEWAFAAERVSIEFDEMRDGPDATDTIWRLMRQGQLGCKIDGGGRSVAHDDAEVIASILARLDMAYGGKGMAVEMARLARIGSAPDWMPGAVTRCVPCDTRLTKHGLFARTEVAGRIETLHRGRKVVRDVLCCPVTFYPSAAKIVSARKHYGAWWLALRAVHGMLSKAGLRTIVLTREMPPRAPWAKGD